MTTTCSHETVTVLLPGEEADFMAPPYYCQEAPCWLRPQVRCTCGKLLCERHGGKVCPAVHGKRRCVIRLRPGLYHVHWWPSSVDDAAGTSRNVR